MKKISMFAYSIFSYLLAFASLLLWILSVSNLIPEISIDGDAVLPFHWALLKNCGLVMLFGLQHSIMARKSFKDRISKIIPVPIERSTFVLISGLLLTILVLNWEPMGGMVWQVSEDSVLYTILYVAFFTGWAILLISTFIINHFDLFGLRQTYLELMGKPYTDLEFQVKGFYKYVRHPLYFGGIVGLWATPVMTMTHLVFAIGLTLYFVIGTLFEERDLISRFGKTYRNYKKQTPMLLPLPKKQIRSFSLRRLFVFLTVFSSIHVPYAQYAHVDFPGKELYLIQGLSPEKPMENPKIRYESYTGIFAEEFHFPNSVKRIHELVSAYDLIENEQYEPKESSSYHLTFKGSQFIARVSYDTEGNIVQTKERYDHVNVPKVLRNEMLHQFSGWQLEEASFHFSYCSNRKSSGWYALQLRKGRKTKRVKWAIPSNV